MSEEIKKEVVAGDTKDQQREEVVEVIEKTPEQIKEEEEIAKKKEIKANLDKAIKEGNEELKKIRQAKKQGKTVEQLGEEEEEEVQIDFKDKGAKAWKKHIDSEVDPLKDEIAKEKEEVRTFALKAFLSDKPNLAKDSEKVKRVMATYEKIKTATERTPEGVLLDLRKAYAAEFADEILQENENESIDRALGAARFSDAGVSRGNFGSAAAKIEKEKAPHLSPEDIAIVTKWGMTPEQWIEMKKKQDKK